MLPRRRPYCNPMATRAARPYRPHHNHNQNRNYNAGYGHGGYGYGSRGGRGRGRGNVGFHYGNGGGYYNGNNGYGGGGGYHNGNGYGGGGYHNGNGYGYSDGMYHGYGYGGGVPGYGVGVNHHPQAAAMSMASTSYANAHPYPDEHLRVLLVAPKPAPPVLPASMQAAETAAGEVLLRLHPTKEAEQRRHEVIAYAKRLIGSTFGCEVFAFGSVPLRTYLPDGDVDITILTNNDLDSNFIQDVCCMLAVEQSNEKAEFVLKEIQYINARVKIIKCVIDNVMVDISFNQVGGVSTVCFLEMVDTEVGKDHLFKRSIILIKAWCYHEGKIHGSNIWLMSTYALEVLILYIFNHFHRSLHGPSEALYKFLDYYSNFDWDNYCLTLDGPVPLSSMWNYTNGPTGLNDGLLLSKEPLKGSLGTLIALPGCSDRSPQFRLKHLNIMDPLKGDNNLGTSVSEANSHIIRKAFADGAERLRQVLKLPCELVANEVYGFFAHTLAKHGRGERQDVGDSVQISGSANIRSHSNSSSSSENGNGGIKHCQNGSSTLVNGPGASSSYPINGPNWTGAPREKVQLPHFAPMNLLDLSGQVECHLACLRSVQYNLEAMYDQLRKSFEEACSAGMIDEDSFIAPTLRPSERPATRPRLAPAYSSPDAGVVAQQSIAEFQVEAEYPSSPGTHIPLNGSAMYPPFAGPWFPNTEDMQNQGASTFVHDMNYSMYLGTDAQSSGMPFYPATWDFRQTRGTGTYIPRTSWFTNGDRSWHDRGRMQSQRQSDRCYIEKRPDQVGSSNGHAPMTRGNPHQGASSSNNVAPNGGPGCNKEVQNSEQRSENGWSATQMPLRIVVPREGAGGQSSSPAVAVVTPAVTMANGQPVTGEQNLEFGTMGPYSATLGNAQYAGEFPSLIETMRQGQQQQGSVRKPKPGAVATRSSSSESSGSAIQSPSPGVHATQSWPNLPSPSPVVGATQDPSSTASTSQQRESPRPGPSAAENRAAGSFQLQDDADFPPLVTEDPYNADFPPLQAAAPRR